MPDPFLVGGTTVVKVSVDSGIVVVVTSGAGRSHETRSEYVHN